MNKDREAILEEFRDHFGKNYDGTLDCNIPELTAVLWLEQQLILIEKKTLERVEEAINKSYEFYGWDDGDGHYAYKALAQLKEGKER